MLHEIKLREEFADAVLNGEKTFEVRYNDRGYQKGDHVKFITVDALGETWHKLEKEEFEITYVLNGWGLKEDYVVFSIRKLTKGED